MRLESQKLDNPWSRGRGQAQPIKMSHHRTARGTCLWDKGGSDQSGEEVKGRGGRHSLAGQSSPELGGLWVHPEAENPFRKGPQDYFKNTPKEGKLTSLNLAKC